MRLNYSRERKKTQIRSYYSNPPSQIPSFVYPTYYGRSFDHTMERMPRRLSLGQTTTKTGNRGQLVLLRIMRWSEILNWKG